MAKKPTRLRFTEDDLADKAVRQAADRAEKAVGKAEKAVEKASKPKKKLRTEADVSKARSSKLRFDKAEIEPELDKPSRGKHMISRASSAAIASKAHQAVSEHEDDNVGVQAVHQSEEAVAFLIANDGNRFCEGIDCFDMTADCGLQIFQLTADLHLLGIHTGLHQKNIHSSDVV